MIKGKKTGKPAWNRGKHPSEETKRKQSESAVRRIRLNLKKLCKECGKEFVDRTSNNISKFCSFKCKYHWHAHLRESYFKDYRQKNRDELYLKHEKYFSTLKGKEVRRKSLLKRKDKIAEWRTAYRSRPEVYEKIRVRKRVYMHTEKGLARARYDSHKRRGRKAETSVGYTKQEFLEKLKTMNGICPICNESFTPGYHSKHELTIDHNPPISKAGKGFVYTIDMISPLCRSCNSKKGNRSILWIVSHFRK